MTSMGVSLTGAGADDSATSGCTAWACGSTIVGPCGGTGGDRSAPSGGSELGDDGSMSLSSVRMTMAKRPTTAIWYHAVVVRSGHSAAQSVRAASATTWTRSSGSIWHEARQKILASTRGKNLSQRVCTTPSSLWTTRQTLYPQRPRWLRSPLTRA
jgi:hypothetical protein